MTWVKGMSGNPKGRKPKGFAMTDQLRKVLALKDEDGTPLSYAIAYNLGLLALKDNVEAIKYVFDRIDGKPIEQVSANIARIPIEFVRHDAGQGDPAADGNAGPIGEPE